MNILLGLLIFVVLLGVPLYAVYDKKRRQNILLAWLLCVLMGGGLASVLSTKDERKDTPKTSTVDLNASVSFTGTQFVVSNKDSFDWKNVKLEINSGLVSSGFILRSDNMRAGETYTVGAAQFAKADGKRFNPFEYKPQNLSVSCDTPAGKGFYYGTWK